MAVLPQPFEILVEQAQDRTVVEPHGELDLYSALQLKDKLLSLFGAGHTDIVLDLNHLDFMDSNGLGVCIEAFKRARREGGTLKLACSRKHLSRMFSITGLDKVFSIYDTVEDCFGETPTRLGTAARTESLRGQPGYAGRTGGG